MWGEPQSSSSSPISEPAWEDILAGEGGFQSRAQFESWGHHFFANWTCTSTDNGGAGESSQSPLIGHVPPWIMGEPASRHRAPLPRWIALAILGLWDPQTTPRIFLTPPNATESGFAFFVHLYWVFWRHTR